MTAQGHGTRIELPWWYARVSRAVGAERAAPPAEPSPAAGVVRDGALAVWNPGAGLEMASTTAGASVVFDGYLFDRGDAARELGIDEGSREADIVAAAYARWGASLFDRLDGRYLAAVWNPQTATLLLGHDALGRHPVFYVVDDEHVWFAPNVLALARSGRIATRPNRLSLALSALAFWPEAGQTYYEAIRRVRPGHYLEVSPRGVAERQYWEPMPADDEPLIDERDVHALFEPALTDAVRRCLALEPGGIMLSGGVDSVTIAALAAPERVSAGRPPLVSVSARTGYRLSHEEEMQTKVAEALHMPLRVSTTHEWIAGRNPIRMSLDLMPELPAPTDVWWVGTYTEFYRRTASQGLTVLLTGAGGDNWLGVADAHAADLMRQLKLRELYAFMKAGAGTGGSTMTKMARRLLWHGGMRWHLDTAWASVAPRSKDAYHLRKWRDRLPRWLAPDRDLRADLLERLLGRRAPSLQSDGRAPRSYYLHSLRTTVNPFMHHELETAFHVESQCGLRLLSPYHDRRLVSFFNRIPPKVLLHGARYKGLLRPVVARRLAGLGLEDQRKDYPADLQERKLLEMRISMGEVWPTFRLDRLGGLGVLDAAAFRRASGDTSQLDFAGLARLYTLMSAERWIGHNTGG